MRELKGFPTDVVLENARSVLLDFQGNTGLIQVMFMSDTRRLNISSINNSEHPLFNVRQHWAVLLYSTYLNDLVP